MSDGLLTGEQYTKQHRFSEVVAPSSRGHPAHPDHFAPRMPHNFVPGQVSAVFRLVRNTGDKIGWVLNHELIVLRIEEGSHSYLAGIREGMKVTAVDATMVRTIEEVKAALSSGTVHNISVDLPQQHEGFKQQSQLQLTQPVTEVQVFDRLPPGVAELNIQKPAGKSLGFLLENMTVTQVAADSPADKHGAEKFIGWKIAYINSRKMGSLKDVADASTDVTEALVTFEVDEITVRKHPEEPLGCELFQMVLTGVTPGSPAERSGLAKYIPYRLTHVNGHAVNVVTQVSRLINGCDAIRLRFEPEEITIKKAPDEPLGMMLDNMVLTGARNDSPSKKQGVGKFVGRRLTHVNGVPVNKITDVKSASLNPEDPSSTALRFEVPGVDEEPEILPIEQPVTDRPVYATPTSVVPLSPHADVFSSGVPYHGVGSNLVIGSAVSRAPVVPERQTMTSILDRYEMDRQRRSSAERHSRLTHLEDRLQHMENWKRDPPWLRSGGGIPWEEPRSPIGKFPYSKHVSPRRPGQHGGLQCNGCGGIPEIECKDCSLHYCRTCCATAHQTGRLRVTHTNMVSKASPATSAPLDGPFISSPRPGGSSLSSFRYDPLSRFSDFRRM